MIHVAVDAFISYSHAADSQLAPALERGLQRLARPWRRLRAVSVFRDQSDLSLTPHLWTTIRDAIDEAGWFVLLASPQAAASQWVNREVTRFCDTKGAERVLIVLTAGELAWDAAAGDFGAGSTALPPALAGRFADEPLWLDLRWARDVPDLTLRLSRFRAAVAQVAAPIRGMAPDELEGEDIRLQRKAIRLARAAVAALTVLAVAASVAAVAAVASANRAREQARRAVGRQVGLAALGLPAARLDEAMLLSLAAADLDPGGARRFEPARVLIGDNARLTGLLHLPAGQAAPSLRAVALPAGPGGRVIATAWRPDGTAALVSWRPDQPGTPTVVDLPAGPDPSALQPAAGSVVLGAIGGAALLVDPAGGTHPLGSRLLALAPDAARALVQDATGRVTVVRLDDGRAIGDVIAAAAPGGGAVRAAEAAAGAVLAGAAGERAVLVAGGRIALVDLRSGRTTGTAQLSAAEGRAAGSGPAQGRPDDAQVVAVAAVSGGLPAAVTVTASGRAVLWRLAGTVLRPGPAVQLPAEVGVVRQLVAATDAAAGAGTAAATALVVGSAGSAVVDLATGATRGLDPGAGGRLAVDPSGRFAAVGGGRLNVWDLRTGSRAFAVPLPVNALAWSGRCDDVAQPCRLVTAGESLDVWTPQTRHRVQLADQTNAQAVAVAPDGVRVATAGWGSAVALWTLAAGGRPGAPVAGAGAATTTATTTTAATVTAATTTVATTTAATTTATAVTVDPASGRYVVDLGGGRWQPTGADATGSAATGVGQAPVIAVGASTRLLLTAGGSRLIDVGAGAVRVWDAATGLPVPLDPPCAGDLVAVSPTSGLLAAHRLRDAATTLCRLDTGAVLARARTRGRSAPATALAVDDSGDVALGGAGVVVHYARTGARWRSGVGVDIPLGGSAVRVASLALRGGILVAGLVPPAGTAELGRVLVWDAARTGTPVYFEVDQADVPAVALLGPGADLLAVAGRDTPSGPVTVQVWEAASRRRIDRGLGGLAGDVTALGGDATAVLAADAAGHAVRWDLDADPAREVCAIVGRSLTVQEWASAAGGALKPYPFSPVCPRG